MHTLFSGTVCYQNRQRRVYTVNKRNNLVRVYIIIYTFPLFRVNIRLVWLLLYYMKRHVTMDSIREARHWGAIV